MLHAKVEQARIAGNILSLYSNAKAIVTPTINQVDFEKSVREDKISFFFDEIVKRFATDKQIQLDKEKDPIKKAELGKKIETELGGLVKVDVVFDSMKKSMWVDIFDTESKTYKDNSLTRQLNLVK
jgi:hypothetical protein